jgi:AAA family ATP:ADP antiporter
MAKSRLRNILSRVVDLKPGEEVIAIFFFLYFFLITAPYYIIKPIRNASYLDRLGDEHLPLAYFLTALLMGFIVNFHSKLQVKIPRRTLVISSLIFFFLNICLFWWLFGLGYNWKWVPVVFWVWANIFAIVLVTQFWILVNDVFNPREAKRLIGFIGSGGQLGAILGGMMAGTLGRTKAASFLLLIAAGMLSVGILLVLSIFAKQRKAEPEAEREIAAREKKPERRAKPGFRDGWETVKQSPYLKLLAGIVMITLVVSTLIDFQFNSIVFNVRGSKNLTSFFGYFNAGTMAFAFLLQLLLTSNIIRRYGIRLTLLFYPLILLLGSAGIGMVAFASIIPAVLIKAGDKSLAYSLNQSVRELLYIPISVEQKYKAKVFIDMFLNRFAKGVGAVILWLLLAILPKSSEIGITALGIRYISLVVAFIILGWILLNLKVGRGYTDTVKEKLKPAGERGDRLVADRVDMDFTKLVFDTVESKDRSSLLYAMHLFDLIRQDKMTPEVKKLISHKEDEVRMTSLGTLFDQTETNLGPEIDDNLSDDVLKKEVQEIMSLDSYQEVMKSYIGKAIDKSGAEGKIARMEVAKAIGLMNPDAPAVEKLDDLLADESPEVSHYAVESAAALKRRESIPSLVKKLSKPVLCDDAMDALVKYGGKIVGTLADYLEDREENPDIRRAVSSVLARIGNQDAADFLSWELAEAEGELARDIIDGLDRIRTENAAVHFPEDAIKSKIYGEIFSYCQNFQAFFEEWRGEKQPEINQAWETRRAQILENIFKLLGLIYPREDIAKANQNLKTGTKDSVAYAVELLDNILEREMRNTLFPLVEDISAEARLARCRDVLTRLKEGKRPK